MPAAIPSNVDGFFGYQFHQVAMYFPTLPALDHARMHWESLGYSNWSVDTADLVGSLHGVSVKAEGEMWFNYDIMPMELELLHYRGESRWSLVPENASPFVSHMSTYVDDVIEETKRLTDLLGFPPFHRFVTQRHSNPHVAGKKRFIESIFDTHSLLGHDTKLIQKVPHDYNDNDWLDLSL